MPVHAPSYAYGTFTVASPRHNCTNCCCREACSSSDEAPVSTSLSVLFAVELARRTTTGWSFSTSLLLRLMSMVISWFSRAAANSISAAEEEGAEPPATEDETIPGAPVNDRNVAWKDCNGHARTAMRCSW